MNIMINYATFSSSTQDTSDIVKFYGISGVKLIVYEKFSSTEDNIIIN